MGMGEAPDGNKVEEGGSDKTEVSLRGLFVAVAVVAFAAAPLLRFMDGMQAVTAAFVGGVAIQVMMIARRSNIGFVASLILTGCLMWAANILWSAQEERSANQKRCLEIETIMLDNYDASEREAAVFQALGCDPQPLAANVILNSWKKK